MFGRWGGGGGGGDQRDRETHRENLDIFFLASHH